MQTVLCQPFTAQPMPTVEAQKIAARKEAAVEAAREEIQEEIVEAMQEIQRLKDELQEDWDDIERCEREEYDLEPAPGEEDIYGCDCSLPTLEADYNNHKFETETEIRVLECEIAELEAKLRRL